MTRSLLQKIPAKTWQFFRRDLPIERSLLSHIKIKWQSIFETTRHFHRIVGFCFKRGLLVQGSFEIKTWSLKEPSNCCHLMSHTDLSCGKKKDVFFEANNCCHFMILKRSTTIHDTQIKQVPWFFGPVVLDFFCNSKRYLDFFFANKTYKRKLGVARYYPS